MITLMTGVPGSGKTLYILNYVKAKSEKENRPVYYSGIPELTLPWLPLDDVEKWYECPANAIIVIDECQRVFRPRATGKEVPECVSRFETHRHQGIDVVLMTQHPMLIDNNIRRIAGQHFHSIRKMGLEASQIYEWGECKGLNKADFTQAVKHLFKFPKESYAWYKSAEVHTHGKRIPMRVWFLLASPLLLGALIYAAYRFTRPAAVAPGAKDLPPGAMAQSNQKKPMTPLEYVDQYKPRVGGLAYTAPIYDEVTKPVRAPIPEGAIATKKECRAYTDQGTRIDVPDILCRQIAARGYYREFDNKPLPEVAQVSKVAKSPTDKQEPSALIFSPDAHPTSVTPPQTDKNDSTNPRFNVAVR